MENFDLVIIGAGPAGLTAAIYAQRANLSYLLLEKGPIGGKVITAYEIENYPGFSKISGSELALTFRKQIKDLNIYFKREEVTRIEKFDDLFFITTNKDRYQTKNIILATGTKENELNVENADKFKGRGVSYCATCDGAFYKDKNVVVYGGGDSAITEATFLAPIVKSLTIISRHELRGEAKNIEKLLSSNNVKCIKNSVITELIGENELKGVKLRNIYTDKTENLPCDGVFVYIGSKPEVNYLNFLNVLNEKGYIETDSHFRTRIEGVYAIGDCIDKELRQIVTATSDGANVIHTILSDMNK